eukprot:m.26813 g.26813  ORF g.26813 m.26813 type:complete len:60 (-) comp10129_c1_seq1:874-1053(-)
MYQLQDDYRCRCQELASSVETSESESELCEFDTTILMFWRDQLKNEAKRNQATQRERDV